MCVEIVNWMPQIESLGVLGSIERQMYGYNENTGKLKVDMSKLIVCVPNADLIALDGLRFAHRVAKFDTSRSSGLFFPGCWL